MSTVSTSAPNCNGEAEVFFQSVARERRLRRAELARWDELDVGLGEISEAVAVARSVSLLARSWLRNGGCPCVSANIGRFVVEQLLAGKLVEAEDGA